MNSEQIQEQLRLLAQGYLERLPSRMQEIEALWLSLQTIWQQDTVDELKLKCHSLSGSAGTYGFHQVADRAHQLEQAINGLPKHGLRPPKERQEELARLLQQLLASKLEPSAQRLEFQVDARSLAPLATRPIYLVDDNIDFSQNMALQLEGFDYEVVIFNNLEELKQAVDRELPGAIIMDLMFPEGRLAGAKLIQSLREHSLRHVPILFISVHEDMQARLEAVRAGSDAYFVKPLEISELVDSLDIIVAKGRSEPYRVVIVDDDQFLAERYQAVLRSAGVDVRVINNPLAVMEVLVEHRPDLLLLDLHMPECNGIELADVLRQHCAYRHLPIVFLSSERDVQKQFEAREHGADDCLIKPIEDQHLISAVINRAQRARSLASQLAQEGMTGLLTHEKFREELSRHAFLCDRYQREFVLCMLDLDHFKQINDRFGHLCGDSVIKRFASTLKQRLRRSDLIARYGGEEFAIIMPDTPLENAAQVIDQIRADFAQFEHYVAGSNIQVTVSGGLALYQGRMRLELLIDQADKALYQAKHAGRNRIVVASLGEEESAQQAG